MLRAVGMRDPIRRDVAIPNVLATLMHHPELATPFLAFNAVLLRRPTLEPLIRELLILRVAWRTGSDYEWLQHVRLARRHSVTTEQIEAVTVGADAAVWSPTERALITAADQLLDDHRIHDGTWAELATAMSPQQLVELVFVVGTYSCLAMAFNSFGLELDPDLRELTDCPRPGRSTEG